MAIQKTTTEAYRLPIIVQELPDLRYNDSDWISQKGRCIAIGSIPVPVLAKLFEVDRRTPDNQEGYQRMPTSGRVNSLKKDLEDRRVDLPTAILLNLRDFNESRHLNSLAEQAELVLSPDDRLYVVDGQHRVEASVSLFKENKENAEEWKGYCLPFVCLLGADRDGEMNEFHVVNSNAKSIPTGLAYELLGQRAEKSETVRDHLVETGKAWIVEAGKLTDKLSKSEIWRGKIRYPGDKKGDTLITNNGMTKSLKPLVELPGVFQALRDKDQQSKVLQAYWEGIKQVLPEAMQDPERYNLQGTLGVSQLHAVLVNVLAIMVSKGYSVFDPARYAEIMRTPLEMGGRNSEDVFVEGADFWKRGSEGVSGQFSGAQGYKALQARIIEGLPSIEVQ